MLEKEASERKEAEGSVNELKRQFSSVKEKTAMIDEEIQQCRDEVNRLLQGACGDHVLPVSCCRA